MYPFRTLAFAVAVATTLGAAPVPAESPPPPVSGTPARVAAVGAPASAATLAPHPDTARAQALLEELKATYPVLDGVTVRMGATPEGHQAVAYYRVGEIVVSPERTASLKTILEHEIWHVIDWRDNGRIDWDEDVPPASAADYRG